MNSFTKLVKLLSALLFAGLFTLHVNAQNNALDFNGYNGISDSDFVDIPYNSTWTPQIISVQLSAKLNQFSTEPQSVFTSGGNVGTLTTPSFVGFGLYVLLDNKWHVLYGTGGGSYMDLAGPSVTLNKWYNMTGTYDGTTIKFYVDGVLVNSATVTIVGNSSLPIRLGAGGAEQNPPTYFYNGQIDEMSMWSKALTPADIAYNSNHGLTGSEANLVSYYNFNQGIGNGNNTSPAIDVLKDLTSHHLDGTLSNTLNGQSYSFTLNGDHSNWVNSGLTLLPINLVNFEGSKKEGSNYLQWSTASEQNSSYFEVQRSTDGVNFTSIAKVDAAGNSDKTLNYSYADNQLSSISSVSYYRLKMVDIDGSSKYSSIINIKNSAIALAKVFPNPASSQFTITIKDNSLLNTKVTLNDISGKVLQKITIIQPNTKVNISNYLSGVYILKFEDGNSIKVIKE